LSTRYAIVGVDTLDQAFLEYLLTPPICGVKVVQAPHCKQVFVTLTEKAASLLTSSGYKLFPIEGVKSSVISAPIDIIGSYDLSPGDTFDLLGLSNFKLTVSPPLSGAGYCVAVIDSGIRSTHQLLGESVVFSKNFTEDEDGDQFDHGTGVASVVHSVTPDAMILDLKVLDSTGEGSEESIILAINECISLLSTDPDIAPNIVNMSLGAPDDGNPDNPVRSACREAMAQGIIIVAAAGNDGPDSNTVGIPACEPYVVAVGSVSKPGLAVSEFSSRGPTTEGNTKPDTTFVGENLVIASSQHDAETFAKSGTSFSTPLVSAVMLLVIEGVVRTYDIKEFIGKNPFASDLVIDNMLPSICSKPKGVSAEKDNNYGYGLPVGSMTYQTTTAAGMIDITGTMAMSISMVLAVAVIRSLTRRQ